MTHVKKGKQFQYLLGYTIDTDFSDLLSSDVSSDSHNGSPLSFFVLLSISSWSPSHFCCKKLLVPKYSESMTS